MTKRRFNAKRWVNLKARGLIVSRYADSYRQALCFIQDLVKEGKYDDELTFRQAIAVINATHDALEKMK